MLKRKDNKLYAWIDAFLLFINLSTSYSIIPYLLLTGNRYINAIIISTVTLLYIIFRFGKLMPLKGHKAFKVYLCLHILCCVSALFTNTGVSSALVYLYSNVVFYYLLHCVYQKKRSLVGYENAIKTLIKPYFALTLITLIGSSLLFFLTKTGMSPMVNDVSHRYDLFADNVDKFFTTYYYPHYLSIISVGSGDLRIPFFQESGFITGLYHEPHCMVFMTFPALPLMLYYSKGNKMKTVMVVTLYIIQLCLAGSTTNIASLLCCFVVYLLYVFKTDLAKTFGLLVALGFSAIIILTKVDLSIFDFIFNKLESGSMTYSMSTIDFAVKPRTLFGTSFFNLSYLHSAADAQRMDVGFIPFVLNIVFLGINFLCLIRLFGSNSKFKLVVLLFSTYFFAHSAKVAMVAYSLTMLMYIVFLLTIVTTHKEASLPNE